MAKLDPSSPGSSSNASLPPRVKPSRPSRPYYGNGQALISSKTPFDYNNFMSDCPSPTTSSSLSPPPTEAALSFDQFAPVGGIDPFAPNMVTSSDASNAPLMGDMFQPSLPFDEDIVQSMQSMSDPNVWQDISLPGMYIFHASNVFFSPLSSAYIFNCLKLIMTRIFRIRLDGPIPTEPWHRHEQSLDDL